MLPLEHSAIPSTFIKLPVVIKTFVLSSFEWPFYTGSEKHNVTGYKCKSEIISHLANFDEEWKCNDQLI